MRERINTAIEDHYFKWQAKCRSVVRDEYIADDLLHHCILLLYSKPQEYIVKAIDEDSLNALMNRLLYSELFYHRSSFNLERKTSFTHIDLNQIKYLACNDEHFRRYINKDLLNVIEKEHGWYPLKVLQLIEIDGWSMVELSKRSGIPRASLAHARKKLKDACKDKYEF